MNDHKEAKKPVESVQGEKYMFKQLTVVQDRLDTAAVRDLLSPEDLRNVTTTITMTQLKGTALQKVATKFEMPSLANATPAGLADMLGDVREEIKVLKKLEGIYADALKARWPEE